jgi:hypothetical protein
VTIASRACGAAWLLCLVALRLHAQAPAIDPRLVQPERPTVATHAHTVAPGYVEIEAGVQGDRIGRGSRAYAAPVVVKLGLASHLQLNVAAPGYFSTASRGSGLGDLSIGLKWRLLDDRPLLGDFAILPAVKLATGSTSRGTGSGSADVGITAISSHDLGPVAMDLNAAYTRIGASSGVAASSAALWTASFGFPVTGKLGWVAELFGQPTIDGSGARSTVALLVGPTFLADRALNLDLGAIVPLRGDVPNALYAGLVWNLGRLPFSARELVRSRAR